MSKRDREKRISKKKIPMKKKNITNIAFLILFLVIVCLAGVLGIIKLRQEKGLDLSYAYDVEESLYGKHAEVNIQTAPTFASTLCVSNTDKGFEGINMSATGERAALFAVDDKKVLFAQGLHEKAYPASITKIMTAILAIKYGNMTDSVTISKNAVTLEEGSQLCGFQMGDIVTMEALFHGLIVYSGNDAAMAIAEQVGGSVENFVQMMNDEAQAIGATNTHFMNPSGLHDEEHYTSVYDIYLMLNEALNYQYFVDTMQLGSHTLSVKRGGDIQQLSFDSTDQYLTRESSPPVDVTVLGGKTGTTGEAGSCLAILSQNKYGEPFVSIVLGTPNKGVLYKDMNQLLGTINS